MDDNIKALLDYLELPTTGMYIITPTTFYLVEGSWLLSPKAHGISMSSITTLRDVRDMKAYALLMNVIGDSKYIVPYMREVIETLIGRVANCSMNNFILVYDKDGTSVEVVGSLVKEMGDDGQKSKMSSKQVWRIDTCDKTVHRYTPNQWMLESSAWRVDDYYQDIAGCLILLNAINNRN